MGPTSYCLGSMLYSSSDVSRIVGNETRTPIQNTPMDKKKKIFHELTRVVSKKSSKGSMGPNNYASGPMLCSSSVVPRLMKSVLKSVPIECFHGHTNISHALASVVGT